MTKQTLLLMSCAALLLTACGGGGSRNDEPAFSLVPSSAVSSSVGATAYVADLSSSPATATDTVEPISALPDTLPTDDGAEPREIP